MLWPVFCFPLLIFFYPTGFCLEMFSMKYQFWSSDQTVTDNRHLSYAWRHGSLPKEFCCSQGKKILKEYEFLPPTTGFSLYLGFLGYPHEKHTFHFWERWRWGIDMEFLWLTNWGIRECPRGVLQDIYIHLLIDVTIVTIRILIP